MASGQLGDSFILGTDKLQGTSEGALAATDTPQVTLELSTDRWVKLELE